jgi:hypothetical protein
VRGAVFLLAMLLTGTASAGSPGISALRLKSSWTGEDPNTRLIPEIGIEAMMASEA